MRPSHEIRNSAKAIIICDGMLLVTENEDCSGKYYLLPGGGQRHGETLHQALWRECLEEIGTDIEVGRLLLVREYIGSNHEFAEHDGGAHQIEFMFECSITSTDAVEMGSNPDGPQTGVSWLPVRSLSRHRIYPSVLVDIIARGAFPAALSYLGDVN